MHITCGCDKDAVELGNVSMSGYDQLIAEAKDMWDVTVLWLGEVGGGWAVDYIGRDELVARGFEWVWGGWIDEGQGSPHFQITCLLMPPPQSGAEGAPPAEGEGRGN